MERSEGGKKRQWIWNGKWSESEGVRKRVREWKKGINKISALCSFVYPHSTLNKLFSHWNTELLIATLKYLLIFNELSIIHRFSDEPASVSLSENVTNTQQYFLSIFFPMYIQAQFFFVRWKSIFNFFCCLLSCAPCEREIKSERENAHFTVNAYICLYKLTNIIFNVCTLNEWSRSVDWNKKLKQCVIVRQIFYLKVEFSCFFILFFYIFWDGRVWYCYHDVLSKPFSRY